MFISKITICFLVVFGLFSIVTAKTTRKVAYEISEFLDKSGYQQIQWNDTQFQTMFKNFIEKNNIINNKAGKVLRKISVNNMVFYIITEVTKDLGNGVYFTCKLYVSFNPFTNQATILPKSSCTVEFPISKTQ